MEKKDELVDQLVKYLNELIDIDNNAVHDLIETRVQVDRLTEHPSITFKIDDDGKHVVGLLGILNGFLGVRDNGTGLIHAEFDTNEKLKKFDRTPIDG